MAICDKCNHKRKPRFWYGYRPDAILCGAGLGHILPDSMMSADVINAIRQGQCKFYNKSVRFNRDGIPYLDKEEDEDEVRYYTREI